MRSTLRSAKLPCSKQVAELARKFKRQGYTNREVANLVGYSQETLHKVFQHYRMHGEDREPCQGKRKRDDVRWIFAGPRGDANLKELEAVKDAGDDADLLSEVHHSFLARGCASPAYRTLCHALQHHLDFTCKRLTHLAKERDITRSLQWRVHVRMNYDPEHLVLVDESASNERTMIRNVGYSRRGAVAKSNHYFLHRGVNHSILGPFVLDGGFLDLSIVEGAFDTDSFWAALNVSVFPHMRPFPEPHSVLVLDNCPIHKQARIVDRVSEIGGIVIFLEPYDPDSMPVEYAFRCMKNFIRINGRDLDDLGLNLVAKLRMAANSVGGAASRHAFHAAGHL
jgi:hypothetical protein